MNFCKSLILRAVIDLNNDKETGVPLGTFDRFPVYTKIHQIIQRFINCIESYTISSLIESIETDMML